MLLWCQMTMGEDFNGRGSCRTHENIVKSNIYVILHIFQSCPRDQTSVFVGHTGLQALCLTLLP